MEKISVGIAGIGLIGGSFAADLIAKGHGIVGYDKDADACAAAMEMGIVHHASTDIKVLDDSEAILIAVPVQVSRQVMSEIAALEAPRLQSVFDSGSTKQMPLKWAAQLGSFTKKFVPCHPIAGAEYSGTRSAKPGMYSGRRVVICDSPAGKEAIELARQLWLECGAEIDMMSADEHDRMFAAVSHLPHMLAYLLVGMINSRPDRNLLLSHAASGFADFSRIASSNEHMWRDVCLANRDNLLAELDGYAKELASLRKIIEAGSGDELCSYFAVARKLRDSWLDEKSK